MSMLKSKMSLKNINVNAKDNGSPLKEILSPSKHVSCNSGKNDEDVFANMKSMHGWRLPDAPDHDVKSKTSSNKKSNGNGGGGMVMLQRPKKKKEVEEDEDEEESVEESSVEEVVENV